MVMSKRRILKKVLLFSFLICFSMLYFELHAETQKFVILKWDDIGGLWGSHITLYDYMINHTSVNIKADFGIIGENVVEDKEWSYLRMLVETKKIDVYCHGMNHTMFPDGTTEFYGRTVEEQKRVLNNFNNLLKEHLNYTTYILGCPFNHFDLNTIEAMKQASPCYEVLFYNSDGWVGGKHAFITLDSSEGVVSNQQVVERLNEFDDECVVMQGHPKWWSPENLTYFLDWLYFGTFEAETGRKVILMTDYYENYYLPNHPDYELMDISRITNVVDDSDQMIIVPEQDTQKRKKTIIYVIVFIVIVLSGLRMFISKKK